MTVVNTDNTLLTSAFSDSVTVRRGRRPWAPDEGHGLDYRYTGYVLRRPGGEGLRERLAVT